MTDIEHNPMEDRDWDFCTITNQSGYTWVVIRRLGLCVLVERRDHMVNDIVLTNVSSIETTTSTIMTVRGRNPDTGLTDRVSIWAYKEVSYS